MAVGTEDKWVQDAYVLLALCPVCGEKLSETVGWYMWLLKLTPRGQIGVWESTCENSHLTMLCWMTVGSDGQLSSLEVEGQVVLDGNKLGSILGKSWGMMRQLLIKLIRS